MKCCTLSGLVLIFALGADASAALTGKNLTALGHKLGKKISACALEQNLPVVMKAPKNGTGEAIDEKTFTEAIREALEKKKVKFMSEASAETDTYLTLVPELDASSSKKGMKRRVIYHAKGELTGSKNQKLACSSSVTFVKKERK